MFFSATLVSVEKRFFISHNVKNRNRKIGNSNSSDTLKFRITPPPLVNKLFVASLYIHFAKLRKVWNA